MWNISKVVFQLPTSSASDHLLQPLWDYLLLRHYTLISSPFFPVLLAFSSYVIFSVPFAVLDVLGEKAPLFEYKIQKERRPTVGMMVRTLGTAVYNHLVFVLPAVLITNMVMPAPPLPTVAPTVWEMFSGGLGALLVFDTQYFLWHMVHHKNPHLYRWVHAIHHDYMSPFSWSTQHLSAVELMTVGFWSNIDPILLKCHPLTVWTLTVFSIWMSVEDHIGYDLPFSPGHLVPFGLLGGAMAHDMHHQKPSSNFAPFFSHWDKIFGTAITVKLTQKSEKEKQLA
ncbi:cholesterol 25-hydroxylase-like protein 1, member 1 [Danio aesculapii]|uniref:cholesterol 25-hydroxylase-like protein 1, member 1 n=1 Tax=Danio aesculapii TaxID=1142201 RepID=UPI0024C04371|nr:cholesterol 25-hydroxylase-like protein 1, member 1 [Danio aesculapii]